MENTDPCSIEQRFSKLRSSAKSQLDFSCFVGHLTTILTDLLNNPLNHKYKVIEAHHDLLSPKRFLKVKDVQDFLVLIGFQERNGQYVHLNSDENMMKLENCLDLVQSYTGSEVTTLDELGDVPEELEVVSLEKKSKSDPNIQERKESSEKKSFTGKVKRFFLLKHLKKEGSDSPLTSFRMEQNNKCKSAEYLFNENGFFQQSSRVNTGTKNSRDNCFLKELFHTQDRNARKWNI